MGLFLSLSGGDEETFYMLQCKNVYTQNLMHSKFFTCLTVTDMGRF